MWSNLLVGNRKSPDTYKQISCNLHKSKVSKTELTEGNSCFHGRPCLLLTCFSPSAELRHHCSPHGLHCPASLRTALAPFSVWWTHAEETLASFPPDGLGWSQTPLLNFPLSSLSASNNRLFTRVIIASSFCFNYNVGFRSNTQSLGLTSFSGVLLPPGVSVYNAHSGIKMAKE